MNKYLLAIPLLLTTCLARAMEAGADVPPSEPVSIIWVILFGILFMGMIVGFFVYLWWKERHRPDGDQA